MMRWRRRRNSVTLADISTRLRGFILDSQMTNAHELALVLGCSPISDEVALMEEDESDRRVAEVSILTPLLYAYAHALSEAAVEHQKNALDSSDKIPKEVWATTRQLIEQVSISILVGAIAQLVDMGMLKMPRKLRRLL
jgi:hypothetical protein